MSSPSQASAARSPAWAWAALALVFGFVYLHGIASAPLRWEEPRRALVTAEMIRRGDYVVPRLLGEPYLNKPPLQSWLIAGAAGGDARRIGPVSVRLPSVLAVAGIALLLFRLGTSSGSGPHPLPALVFLTFGILPQYGRAGEIDLPFTFFVAAALAAFELGRRRGSGALQWIVSQALVAGGILTKGLAPLFFHPPALIASWHLRLALRAGPLALGLLLMLGLVAAWLLPYAGAGRVAALGERLGSELAQRTTEPGTAEMLRHLVRYPVALLGASAPWSLLLLALGRRRTREAIQSLFDDPWLALCGVVAGWGALVFAFVPGSLPRYLIPVLPAAAVVVGAALVRLDRPSTRKGAWLALAAAWLVAVPLLARWQLDALTPRSTRLLAAATVGLGLLALAAARELARRQGWVTGALLAAGLLYGLAYAGIVESRAAVRHRAFVAAAEALAPHLRPGLPAVVAVGTDRRFTWPLVQRLERLVVEKPPAPPYDLAGPADLAVPPRSRLVAESGGFAVWRVRAAPQAAAPPGGAGR